MNPPSLIEEEDVVDGSEEEKIMNANDETSAVRSYGAQCQSLCPIVCDVRDGKLVKISRDKDHPHATPLCPKGLAGPELVYDPQRLKYPLKRTRPKGEPYPGWERISWDDALDTIAWKLNEIKNTHGAHTVARVISLITEEQG